MYISESSIRKILKEAGASRIGDDAVREFHKYLNKTAFEIGKKAVELSKHAKRKTISASDIKLACG